MSSISGGGVSNVQNLQEVTDEGASTTNDVTTAKLTASKEDAVNNAVSVLLDILHETSGVPANGIGVAHNFTVETSNGNNEILAVIEAIAKDVTAGSEDASLILKTMAAGAAAVERIKVEGGATSTTMFFQGLTNAFISALMGAYINITAPNQVHLAPNAKVGGSAGTNTTSVILEVGGTTKGFLVPVVTTSQRTSISTPANGLMVYDSDLDLHYYYNSAVSGWRILGRNYRQVVVTVTQAGTAAPTFNTVINETGLTLSWVRTLAGIYDGTLTGAFAGEYKFDICLDATSPGGFRSLERLTDNTFRLNSMDASGTSGDDEMFGDYLTITIYD